MKNLGLFYFIFLLIGANSCNENQIKVNSAKIDQVLIPVLYDITYHNYEDAERSVATLKSDWESYGSQMSSEQEYSDKQSTISAYIGGQLDKLSCALGEEDYTKSVTVFEDIQQALSDWRTAYNTEYYLDDWFKFKYDVDIFTCIAEDELLDLCEWKDLEWQYRYIFSNFYFLNTYVYDLEYFDISEKNFDVQLERLSGTMMNLNAAMETADREKVAAAAHLLQEDILGVLFMFGEMPESYAGM